MSNYLKEIENYHRASPPGTGYHRAGRVAERAARVAEWAAARVAEQVTESVWRESEEDETK